MCVHHDAAKHGCDHLDVVNRNWIHLKKGCLATRTSRFVVDHIFEDAPICDAASRVTSDKVSELRFHASANVVELFVQTAIILDRARNVAALSISPCG
ncbi:hypothetical protein TNCV_4979011 [Trichonephila clavipes]|nr:hypothetical protein TNCV_4979011 [Trichonephila clavipes]